MQKINIISQNYCLSLLNKSVNTFMNSLLSKKICIQCSTEHEKNKNVINLMTNIMNTCILYLAQNL